MFPSESYSPAELLTNFVKETGSSLSTVTNLGLIYEQQIETTHALDEAMVMLVKACPIMKNLRGMERMSQFFQQRLGEVCPLLCGVSMSTRDYALDCLQKFIDLQPSLLPQLSSLCLPGMNNLLPDMSGCVGITDLQLGSYFGLDSQWLILPPKLQKLRCALMFTGPPHVAADGIALGSLLNLEFNEGAVNLHTLAQLLQAAPSLTSLQKKCQPEVCIKCVLDASMAADLRLVLDHTYKGVKDAVFFIVNDAEKRLDMQALLASMPRMDGVKKCKLQVQDLNLSDLGPLLKMFPDVQELSILYLFDMGDTELLLLTACKKLTWLELEVADEVTPTGLVSLCQTLPGLKTIRCTDCAQLKGYALQLAEYGQLVGRDISITDDAPQ